MTLSNISSKARIWSGVFTELNSGFSDLQSGMQNSFRCLVAVNLCLAKRVNRDISAKYDLPPTTCHLPLPPATCHCHLPPTTCYHFSSLKKRAWQNIKLQHLSHLPPATTHLPPATNSKARTWSGVFTELNSGFSDLQWSCDEEYE